MSSTGIVAPTMPAGEVDEASFVLLVEDDPRYGRLVAEMLRRSSPFLKLVHASDLGHAERHLRDPRLRCALVDLSLPDAENLEAVTRLRSLAPSLPLIVLTGRSDEELGLSAVQAGAQDYLVKTAVDGDILNRSIRYAVERSRTEAALTHLALHDALTGLPNRSLFLDRLRQALMRAQRRRTTVGLLFLDLDRFKLVNDSLGHEAGDELLLSVADRLRTIIRPEDTLARMGGDEFTILCEDLRQGADAVMIAQRAARALSEPFRLSFGEIVVSPSIGIALSEPEQTPASLLRNADVAMYWAKQKGGNRYEMFDGRLREQVMHRLEVERDLRQALHHDELRVVYQPIVEVATGTISRIEALMRWQHPERGLLDAAEFVNIAEETGLVVPLGAWVLRRACQDMRQWRDGAAGGEVPISVNLSARQLTDPELPSLVSRTLYETGVDADQLCLEVTETAVMEDAGASLATLRALDQLGVHLAIDHFGSGYSSLAYLKRFPVKLLKVDRSFVQGLGVDEEDEAIVAAVVGLARSLGRQVVAGGVERAEQIAHLRELECEFAQGFLLAPPQPVEGISDMLRLEKAEAAPALEGSSQA